MDYQGVEIMWCAERTNNYFFIDLSLELDGRLFAGENEIFTKYSVTHFQISLLYFAATVLHLRKKNIETKLTVKLV